MENKEDIGRVFSKKLSALEKSPSDKVWLNISAELQKKKKRRVIFFFFSAKTTGLLLLGVIAAGYLYFENNTFNPFSPNHSNDSKTIIDSKANQENSTDQQNSLKQDNSAPGDNGIILENEKGNKNESAIENENTIGSNSNSGNSNTIKSKPKTTSVSINSKNNYSKAKGIKKLKNKSKQWSKLSSKNTKTKIKKSKGQNEKAKKIGENNVTLNQTINPTTKVDLSSLQNKDILVKDKDTILKKQDSLASNKEKEKDKTKNIFMHKKEEDSTETFRRFDVDVFVSPTHYGYLSKYSTLDNRLDSISKSGAIQLSYGVGLTYELTEKYSIRIGYSKVNMRFSTNDALVNTTNYRGISYNSGVTNQTIYAASNGAEKMDITQNISYSEIPLEIKYRFRDRKIGMSAIFGFSYAMLGENSVTIKTNNGFSQEIGRTKNILDTAISTNIGIGLDYEISKNTKLILEPMFNYQIMSFEDSKYKPYYFGIHTGIRYTFLNK